MACDSRQAGAVEAKTIEVTPEMIAAGTQVLYAADYRFERHEDVVIDILQAAFKTRKEAK